MKRHLILPLLFLFMAMPFIGNGHAPEQSYVYFNIYKDHIEGRFEMTVKDINRAVGLNLPEDATVEQITPYLEQIYAYYRDRVSFSSDQGAHAFNFNETTVFDAGDLGNFYQFRYKLDNVNAIPEAIKTKYNVLFDQDIKHLGMLMIEYNWKAGIYNNEAKPSLTFSPISTEQTLSLAGNTVLKGFIAMIIQGIWHIWIGIDHILFLLALILPSVVRRFRLANKEEIFDPNDSYSKVWAPVKKFRPAFIYIIKIITFFTIAHTVTLSMAALGVINLPGRFVESVIALSIALAAVHNIYPLYKNPEWVIAFGFGLFHGFGFASVLGDIGLSGEYTVLSLLGFNLGVEIGQVAIIIVLFPILYFLRKLWLYPKILLYGSIILILISLYWFIERAFEVDLPLGRILKPVLNLIGL
ncbi:MAG: HupE/UreJ family protein [Bacteroidota bacterium]